MLNHSLVMESRGQLWPKRAESLFRQTLCFVPRHAGTRSFRIAIPPASGLEWDPQGDQVIEPIDRLAGRPGDASQQ